MTNLKGKGRLPLETWTGTSLRVRMRQEKEKGRGQSQREGGDVKGMDQRSLFRKVLQGHLPSNLPPKSQTNALNKGKIRLLGTLEGVGSSLSHDLDQHRVSDNEPERAKGYKQSCQVTAKTAEVFSQRQLGRCSRLRAFQHCSPGFR